MHPNPRRIIPIVLLVLIAAGGYYVYTHYLSPAANSNTASGFIEGEEVSIAAEIGGRIEAINADEGDAIKAGQVIVQLDRTMINAQLAQAQAALDTANAQLTQIKNGPRASDISAAKVAVDAAQQNYDKLRAGGTASDVAAAQAGVDAATKNYAKLRAGGTASDVAAAQAGLDAATKNYDKVKAGFTVDQLAQIKAQVDTTKAALDQAQALYDRAGGSSNPLIGQLPQSVTLQQATNAYKAANSALNDALTHPTPSELAAANSQVDQAQAVLARLTPDAAQLAAAKSQVDQAQAVLARLTPDAAQLAAAKSQVDQAQAALDRLTPTIDSINVAENQAKQANTALGVLQVQLAKMTLKSPGNGIVTRRVAHVGELAAPNAMLLSVANLDTVKLTIYVPETQIGQIKIGDTFPVQVDSFPNKIFDGKVIYIANQAEFTPRNVQTKTERVNTVFAVKLQIANPNFDLKPGMPADATLK